MTAAPEMVGFSNSNIGGIEGRRLAFYLQSQSSHFQDSHREFFFGNPILPHINLSSESTAKQSNIRLWGGAFYVGGLDPRSIHTKPGSSSLDARDYYDNLGISKSANSDEIKKTYDVLTIKLHPDTNRDDPDAEKKLMKMYRIQN